MLIVYKKPLLIGVSIGFFVLLLGSVCIITFIPKKQELENLALNLFGETKTNMSTSSESKFNGSTSDTIINHDINTKSDLMHISDPNLNRVESEILNPKATITSLVSEPGTADNHTEVRAQNNWTSESNHNIKPVKLKTIRDENEKLSNPNQVELEIIQPSEHKTKQPDEKEQIEAESEKLHLTPETKHEEGRNQIDVNPIQTETIQEQLNATPEHAITQNNSTSESEHKAKRDESKSTHPPVKTEAIIESSESNSAHRSETNVNPLKSEELIDTSITEPEPVKEVEKTKSLHSDISSTSSEPINKNEKHMMYLGITIIYGFFDAKESRVFYVTNDHRWSNFEILKTEVIKHIENNNFHSYNSFKLGDSNVFYRTEFDNDYLKSIEFMQRYIHYSGMEGFLNILKQEGTLNLETFNRKDVFLISPKSLGYELKPPVSTDELKITGLGVNMFKRLYSGWYYYNYAVGAVEIDNLFKISGLKALRFDFLNAGNSNENNISEELFKKLQKRTDDVENFADFNLENFLVHDTMYENYFVLYKSSGDIKNIIQNLIKNAINSGLEVAFNELFQKFTIFPETTILLIGKESELNILNLIKHWKIK